MKLQHKKIAILISLALLFITPGLAAYVFYQYPQWLSGVRTNKGTLLEPPQRLAVLPKAKKWSLILWNPEDCDHACIQQLDKLARIRLALGRRWYEVRTFLLLGTEAHHPSRQLMHALKIQDIGWLSLTKKETQELHDLTQIPVLWIANPDNEVVLVYSVQAKPDDLFHDLKRLLHTQE
jgi:hypothetical protein